jgi:hypothetical protein
MRSTSLQSQPSVSEHPNFKLKPVVRSLKKISISTVHSPTHQLSLDTVPDAETMVQLDEAETTKWDLSQPQLLALRSIARDSEVVDLKNHVKTLVVSSLHHDAHRGDSSGTGANDLAVNDGVGGNKKNSVDADDRSLSREPSRLSSNTRLLSSSSQHAALSRSNSGASFPGPDAASVGQDDPWLAMLPPEPDPMPGSLPLLRRALKLQQKKLVLDEEFYDAIVKPIGTEVSDGTCFF